MATCYSIDFAIFVQTKASRRTVASPFVAKISVSPFFYYFLFLLCIYITRPPKKTFVEDGFGKVAFYKCLVAEVNDENSDDKKIVGYSLYYFTYSTWEGKSIYMEDLYVTPKFRHNGIGESLWKAVVKAGLEKGCCRTDFTVLAWNTPSIEFYLKKGAYDLTTKEEWHLFRMNKDEMNKFCNE